MKYFSMFSGIGGFELGIKNSRRKPNLSGEWKEDTRSTQDIQNNWNKPNNEARCVGFSEINKYSIATYKKHFPNHKNYGDATKINPKELPDFDMLCGGFPCQSFSVAGKRLGFEDTRGTLFFDIARIAKVKRPQILFLENVKGLLSHDNGRTFTIILTTLDELGYNAEWQCLNSKYFGVPQNRERVFIIGHLRGTSSRQIFPFRKMAEKNTREIKRSQIDISGKGYASQQDRIYNPDGIMACLPNANPDNKLLIFDGYNKQIKKDQDILGTIRTNQGCATTGNTIFDSLHGFGHGWQGYHNQKAINKGLIRRLTPIECERLQGFPDNWTIGSDTQRYKQCGNAVTVNVIEAIAKKLQFIQK